MDDTLPDISVDSDQFPPPTPSMNKKVIPASGTWEANCDAMQSGYPCGEVTGVNVSLPCTLTLKITL